MKTLLIAIVSIAFSVAAQFSLKLGMSSESVRQAMDQSFTLRTFLVIFTEKYVVGGFLLYGLGAIAWLGVLSKWNVSKAYPLVGLGFVFTVIIGILTGEQVNLSRSTGVLLICAGIFLVARS